MPLRSRDFVLLKCFIGLPFHCCPPLGSCSLALAEDFVRADGDEKGRDAPPATGGRGGGGGRQGADDAASYSLLPKRAQGRLPQLLLEDIHLVLTQDRRCSSGSIFAFNCTLWIN